MTGGLPPIETVQRVEALIPEVMSAKKGLAPEQAGVIIVVHQPAVDLWVVRRDGTETVRRISFPGWRFQTVAEAPEGSHPFPRASEVADRVCYYLSLAADRSVPIGGYAYTGTSHAPFYRGYESSSSLSDAFFLSETTDAEIERTVVAWYRIAEGWLEFVPKGSVLDRAVQTRMRVMAGSRRDAILGAWAAMEALAEAEARSIGPLDSVPESARRLAPKDVDQGFRAVLARWNPGAVTSLPEWRALRNRIAHPFGPHVPEEEVWNRSREMWEVSGRVLRGALKAAVGDWPAPNDPDDA